MSEIILVIPPVDLSALGRVYQVNRLSFVELARAIENLIYPGRHLDISDAYNTFAEASLLLTCGSLSQRWVKKNLCTLKKLTEH